MIPLTFESLAVSICTICTTNLKVQKFYILPTEYLSVFYVSQKKSFSYIALDWFL
jgi:hypothetical protein